MTDTPSPMSDDELVERMARVLYESSCRNDPLDPEHEPDWGRGGFKTQVLYWQALARALLPLIREVQSGWETIETAPRDGTRSIVATASGYVTVLQFCEEGYWRSNGAKYHHGWDPTHWQPLPTPPNTITRED